MISLADAETEWVLAPVSNLDGDDEEDEIVSAPAAADFVLESSVDPDNPPKIGERITLTVMPETGFSEHDPIVYYFSQITASGKLFSFQKNVKKSIK